MSQPTRIRAEVPDPTLPLIAEMQRLQDQAHELGETVSHRVDNLLGMANEEESHRVDPSRKSAA